MSLLRDITSDDIERVMQAHFDPVSGAVYWINYAREKGFKPSDVHGLEDFISIVTPTGKRAEEYERDLAHAPLDSFMPHWLRDQVSSGSEHIYPGETGGTTGAYPKRGYYSDRVWSQQLAFGNEDLNIAGIPEGINWIWAGPTGPHAIGRYALELPRLRGGMAFPLDLDTRWIKIAMAELGGLTGDAFTRYMGHIAQQMARLLEKEDIQAIFTTSVILQRLEEVAEKVGFDLSELQGILHGGTALMPPEHQVLREEMLPCVPFTGLYGSSITGADSFQKPLEPEDEFAVVYVPNSPMIHLRIVDPTTKEDVGFGEEGQVVRYRFTDDFLVPGLEERDLATKVKPYGRYAEQLPGDFWLANIHSAARQLKGQDEVQGVY